MKWRQAKKIIKKYAGNFYLPFFSDGAPWVAEDVPHKLKQTHIKRWFEGEDE